MPAPTLDDMRRHAVARTLFTPTTLPRALKRLGFVQADPIRAPARAQDLVLRHRVRGYHAGDLDRRYPRLDVEEDFFVNHGYLPRAIHHLMHPREAETVWPAERWKLAQSVLDVVRERGVVHPNEVDAELGHGRATNWFGGSSRISTQLLDGLQYRGLLRVAGRRAGVRLYALREPGPAVDRLVDVAVALYAPLPAATLGQLVSFLAAGGVPQWRTRRAATLRRAQSRVASASVDGQRWFWPADERPASARHRIDDEVRLLAPFDPIVWDRRRFEQLWGWAYRFEAYTPAARRQLGYYALPLLWRGQVIGWANARRGTDGRIDVMPGYVSGRPPRDGAYRQALDDEIGRLRESVQAVPSGSDADRSAAGGA
jgi:uncharacterized protein